MRTARKNHKRLTKKLRAGAKKKQTLRITKTSLMAAVARLKVEREELINDRCKLADDLLLLKRRLKQPYVWRTRDGRRIDITQMDEGHLRNTVCFLQRRLSVLFGSATYLQDTAHLVEALDAMFKECKRRGIDV